MKLRNKEHKLLLKLHAKMESIQKFNELLRNFILFLYADSSHEPDQKSFRLMHISK